MLEAALEGGKVVLSLAGADGFLADILPSGAIEWCGEAYSVIETGRGRASGVGFRNT